jgi:hypothetical protein
MAGMPYLIYREAETLLTQPLNHGFSQSKPQPLRIL